MTARALEPKRGGVCLLFLGAWAVAACTAPPGPVPESQRLVDVFEAAMVENAAEPGPPPAPTEWRFDGPAPEPPPEVAARLPADEEAAAELSPEELDRLRFLGYVQ